MVRKPNKDTQQKASRPFLLLTTTQKFTSPFEMTILQSLQEQIFSVSIIDLKLDTLVLNSNEVYAEAGHSINIGSL